MSSKERDVKQEMLAEIESNSMYRSAMELATDADRETTRRAVEAFISQFADDLIVPLMKSIEKPELKKALIDKLRGVAESAHTAQYVKKPDGPNEGGT